MSDDAGEITINIISDLPQSVLKKLYSLCGSDEQGRGFIICYINRDGNPKVSGLFQNGTLELGVRKKLEQWLKDKDEVEFSFDSDFEDFDEMDED